MRLELVQETKKKQTLLVLAYCPWTIPDQAHWVVWSCTRCKDVQIQSGHARGLHSGPKTKPCCLPLYLLVGELRRKCLLLSIKNSVLSPQMYRIGGSRLKQLLLGCPRQGNETRNSKFSIHIEQARGWLQWSSAWGEDVSTWNKNPQILTSWELKLPHGYATD